VQWEVAALRERLVDLYRVLNIAYFGAQDDLVVCETMTLRGFGPPLRANIS